MAQPEDQESDRFYRLESYTGVRMDSYKIDEGYSEGTRSQEGLDSPMRIDNSDEAQISGRLAPGLSLQDAVLALSENERKEFAYNILRSLRASTISSVVDQLWPLFHKDPVAHFPAEITHQIFGYLDPKTLIEASKVSKAWMTRALDGRLWREKFKREGWGLNNTETGKYERYHEIKGASGESATLPRRSVNRSGSRSRLDRGMKTKNRQSQQAEPTSIFSGPVREDIAQMYSNPPADEEMPDVEDVSMLEGPQSPQNRSFNLGHGEPQDTNVFGASSTLDSVAVNDAGGSPGHDAAHDYMQRSSLLIPAGMGSTSLNYHYIFKQKRKLEENWNAGRYKSFQLPHRDHREDAHRECVYTIQYMGKYLVSGSRDRTLRIWDLDTQRLARKPLQGHSGSVLCLQFDPAESEDIIISGSSDTHVILWRFSTGHMIRQLTNAHKESVLNLRFDKRFLVTCSKDKTIKIWSRQELRPGDAHYPLKGINKGGQCPSYIIDFASIAGALKFGPSKPEHLMLLEPYTHLMTLDLHGAAVNAIQIYEDQLVSASGDRCLRVWNIHTGECTTKIEAHSKGIACVQYDGKRIVSGSSDNTIRIWDPVSHVEVARLEGHSRLVRTVQAAFVDAPGGREGLEAEAAEVDRQWRIAHDAGLLSSRPSRRGQQPIPGSRKPNDIRGINAKIPPSGGGSRWSHIVSGSYDETVIIWKKTEDDEWVIGHRLRQEEALTAAGPDLPSRTEQSATENVQEQSHPPNLNQINPSNLPLQFAPQQPTSSRAGQQPTLQNGQPRGSVVQALLGINPPQTLAQHLQQPTAVQQQPTVPTLQQQQPPPAPRPPHQIIHNGAPVGQPNARVFKLQFDARRIICCSQDPKIVGWDFANDDEEIMECSRFFAPPQ